MDIQSVMSGGKTIPGVIEGDAAPRELSRGWSSSSSRVGCRSEKLIRRYDFEDIERSPTPPAADFKPVPRI